MIILRLLVLALLPALSPGADPAAGKPFDFEQYRLGVEAATRDLEAGRVRYDVVRQGLVVDPELQRMAKQKLGIEVIFHGCVMPENQAHHLGYHGTVVAFLKFRHHHDPVEKLKAELLGDLKPREESSAER